MALTKGQAAWYKALYKGLVAKPAEEIRDLAVRQRDQALAALKVIRDAPGDLFSRWRAYDFLEADVNAHLKDGDDLRDKTDEESRKERRRQYATAYLTARQLAEEIEGEKILGSTYRVLLEDSWESAAKAAQIAAGFVYEEAKGAAKAVASAGGDLLTGVLVVLGLGAFAYGWSKGKR